MIDHIPIDNLSTAGSTALDKQDPCRSVPADVVTPAGFPGTPLGRDEAGCQWLGAEGLLLNVGDVPLETMAGEVTEHIDMANGREPEEPLSHLVWLLLDGHYAIERILKSDMSSTCSLEVDLNSPTVVFVMVYAIDLTTRRSATTSPEDSVTKFCPSARIVAQNLLHHLLDQPAGPAGPGILPTR